MKGDPYNQGVTGKEKHEGQPPWAQHFYLREGPCPACMLVVAVSKPWRPFCRVVVFCLPNSYCLHNELEHAQLLTADTKTAARKQMNDYACILHANWAAGE